MNASPNPKQHVQTALITGASSGIGADLARVFASNGYALVLVARTEAALNTLADELRAAHGVTVTVIPHDLSHPDAPQAVFDATQQANITVDVLVNNAGYASYGPFAQADLRNELAEMQVNTMGLTALTRLFLPSMIQHGRGGILNLASTAAFQPGPNMAVYCATKAFVLSFTESLAFELRKTGVKVTALCPGATRSKFFDRANMSDVPFARNNIMDSTTVARIGYQGLMRGRSVVIPGTRNRLLAIVTRLTPRSLVTRMAGQILAPTHN